jgi:fucose 4-O-acetylase-like acetyltransferase
VRTVAMLSIVAFHVEMRPLFGVAFGLSTLQVIMCALAARYAAAPDLGPFAAKRAIRLLAPFVFWSLVHVVVEVLLAWRYEVPVASRFHPRMWIMGGSFHLWFLPFAFAASLLVNCGARWSGGARLRPAILLSALVGAALVCWGDVLKGSVRPVHPFDLWLDGSAAVAFGFALGRTLTLAGAERLRWLALILALAVTPWLLGPSLTPHSQLWARYALAVPIACSGFLLPLPRSRVLGYLSSYNLGVYAVHMLAIRAVARLPVLRELELGGRIAAVYLLCLFTVHVLRRAGLKHVV